MNLIQILTSHNFAASAITEAAYQRVPERPSYILRVPQGDALAQWQVLHSIVPAAGYCPVLGWERFKQPPWIEEYPDDIVAKAVLLDVSTWFQAHDIARVQENLQETAESSVPPQGFSFRIVQHRFPFSADGYVPIALLPTAVSWEVPAYIDLTGDDPPAEVHVAILKYWYERWQAELVGAVSGEIELQVAKLPATTDALYELAAQQYIYSPDIVEQEVGSVAALARKLSNSKVWWFWWD